MRFPLYLLWAKGVLCVEESFQVAFWIMQPCLQRQHLPILLPSMLRLADRSWQQEQRIAPWGVDWLRVVIWMEQWISVWAVAWVAVVSRWEQRQWWIADGILGCIAISTS